jgi:hypothetical protein
MKILKIFKFIITHEMLLMVAMDLYMIINEMKKKELDLLDI